MSSIHALQSSTSSRKLLESVRSLRPLFCEALRTSDFYAFNIDEQDPSLHTESQQLHDVKHSNSHGKVALTSDMHGSPCHVGAQTQYNDGDAVRQINVVVHHDEYGHYHDAHHHEYGSYEDVYHQELGQHVDDIHLTDAHRHGGHAHHRDAHHHGHGHGQDYCHNISNSIIASMDNCIWHQQIYAYHNHDLEQHISSETTDFGSAIVFEAPYRYIEGNCNEALGADPASNESIISNEVLNAQDRSRCSINDQVLEASADHKVINCKELPYSKTPNLRKRKQKGPVAQNHVKSM